MLKHSKTLGLSPSEHTILKKLNTPIKIQDFLDTLPVNWEKKVETHMSPRRVLRERKAHCIEGAFLAATALWLQNETPLLLDLKTSTGDDHVVALYKRNGYWGAISKTNHATLRFRDPVYKTIRELALSYFHEYFDERTNKKILESYSEPFNLKKLGIKWITSEKELFDIAEMLDDSPHHYFLSKKASTKNIKLLRKADKMEQKAGKLIEWRKNHLLT